MKRIVVVSTSCSGKTTLARGIKDVDRAYAVFANCGSEECDAGVRQLLIRLMDEHGN